jgi:hypothetical protein
LKSRLDAISFRSPIWNEWKITNIDAITSRKCRVWITEDLQKPGHSLKRTNGGAVEAVLQVGHGDVQANQKTFPVLPEGSIQRFCGETCLGHGADKNGTGWECRIKLDLDESGEVTDTFYEEQNRMVPLCLYIEVMGPWVG